MIFFYRQLVLQERHFVLEVDAQIVPLQRKPCHQQIVKLVPHGVALSVAVLDDKQNFAKNFKLNR